MEAQNSEYSQYKEFYEASQKALQEMEAQFSAEQIKVEEKDGCIADLEQRLQDAEYRLQQDTEDLNLQIKDLNEQLLSRPEKKKDSSSSSSSSSSSDKSDDEKEDWKEKHD